MLRPFSYRTRTDRSIYLSVMDATDTDRIREMHDMLPQTGFTYT
jgi:hypothetical protein